MTVEVHDAIDGFDERADGAIAGLIRTGEDLELIFLRRGSRFRFEIHFRCGSELRS